MNKIYEDDGGIGDYFERGVLGDISMSHGYEHYEEYIEVLCRPDERRRRLRVMMRQSGLLPSRSVVDVGAAMGHNVKHLMKLGFRVIGVEPSCYARQRAWEKFGLNLLPGSLSMQELAAASVDAVTYFDVFEHISDPRSELAEVRRILNKEGALILELPNQASLVAEVIQEDYLFSEHLLFFGPSDVCRLLSSSGFRVRSIWSSHDEYYRIERNLPLSESRELLSNLRGERLFVVAEVVA